MVIRAVSRRVNLIEDPGRIDLVSAGSLCPGDRAPCTEVPDDVFDNWGADDESVVSQHLTSLECRLRDASRSRRHPSPSQRDGVCRLCKSERRN